METTGNMETLDVHATVLNVQMLLPNVYVIGISWNTLRVQAVILLLLEAVYEVVMFAIL